MALDQTAPAGAPASTAIEDLPFNLESPTELGTATVHHVGSEETIAELERLLGVELQ